MALLAKHPGDRQADAARRAGDDRRPLGHPARTLQWPAVPRFVALCLLLLAAGGLACGSDGSVVEAPPESTLAGFPSRRTTLFELRAGLPAGPVLSPTVTVVRPERSRVAFRLLDPPDGAARPDAAALYVARVGGRDLRGPFVARRESLRVAERFRSDRRAGVPDVGREHWVAEVEPPGAGPFVLTALVREGQGEDARLATTNQLELRAVPRGGPPGSGEPAIPVETDRADSREPPLPELHRTDLADVLGRRPVLLVFASPGHCPTRVCSQVVDAAAQVHAETGIETIHQETFVGDDLDDGVRPQVRAWGLPTPAWTFVIDARGRVSDRFEGAVSVRELRRAVERVGTR